MLCSKISSVAFESTNNSYKEAFNQIASIHFAVFHVCACCVTDTVLVQNIDVSNSLLNNERLCIKLIYLPFSYMQS